MSEFPEVFAEDISGLPPECKVDFSIDLVPGTSIVRKSAMHMVQVFVMLASLESICKGVVCDLPKVCQFLEVFLDDICVFPPKREVEFTIDLVPGTYPMLMTPYRMPASDLSEVKKQLEDLLEKKFVRLSVSLWGGRCWYSRRKMVA